MRRRDLLTTLGTAAAGLAVGESMIRRRPPRRTPRPALHRTAPPAQSRAVRSTGSMRICARSTSARRTPISPSKPHHYCTPVNDEVHQCVVFDSAKPGARILGIEYIISDRLYRDLPDDEKKYYHPHTYEITSGLLIAPGLPPAEETKFLGGLLTTWGKTWHTWPDPKTELPMGEPMLMWAATKDGQITAEMLADRDKKFKVSTPALRKQRAHLGPVPQIDAPTSINSIGRQWTNAGPDKPRSEAPAQGAVVK